jgi:hypothetical protein
MAITPYTNPVVAYNHFSKHRYTIAPGFFVINFEELDRTHRCNPPDKENMLDKCDIKDLSLLPICYLWLGIIYLFPAISFIFRLLWAVNNPFIRSHKCKKYDFVADNNNGDGKTNRQAY